jgi:Flp pilus assembly protein CpaB
VDKGSGLQKEFIYIAVALIAGVGAVWYANKYVSSQLSDYKATMEKKDVLLKCNRDVGIGDIVKQEFLETIDVPAVYKFGTYAVKDEDKTKLFPKDDKGNFRNPTVVSPIAAGQLLMWYQLDMGAAGSISEKIPLGKKGITFPVTNVSGAGYLLRPKMVVDVYVAFQVREKGQTSSDQPRQVAKLLDNVTIIATGDTTVADSSAERMAGGRLVFQTVTVLVEEPDVERVILAVSVAQQSGGGLYCVLRSERETGASTPSKAMTEDELLKSLGAK